jgi:hypothetical protein
MVDLKSLNLQFSKHSMRKPDPNNNVLLMHTTAPPAGSSDLLKYHFNKIMN